MRHSRYKGFYYLILLLSSYCCSAQKGLAIALDKLEKNKLISSREKELLNKKKVALEKRMKDQSIHPSDGITEIYLTNEQYEFLISHHLLEFSESDTEK